MAEERLFLFVNYEGGCNMNFNTLFTRISPRLKRIARNRNSCGFFIDQDDLYQEMCVYLWDNFKDGVPAGINNTYIIRGCEFYISNYLRKKREKVVILSLNKPIDKNGGSLENILAETNVALDKSVVNEITIDQIKKNGLTKREKEVFALLLKGYTAREAGKELGISHVMVIKFKQRIIKKWQTKKKIKVI